MQRGFKDNEICYSLLWIAAQQSKKYKYSMEDESEAAQGQTTATGNAALSVSRDVADVSVRPKSTPGYSGAAYIRKEFRKGALQKEIDTSCPLKAAQPIYKHQHHTKKAFNELNQLRK